MKGPFETVGHEGRQDEDVFGLSFRHRPQPLYQHSAAVRDLHLDLIYIAADPAQEVPYPQMKKSTFKQLQPLLTGAY